MRMPDECINLVRNDTFAPGLVRTYRDIFPLSGEGWRTIRLTYSYILGVSAAPVPLGGFHFVRNITLRTSKGETPVQTPGMGLYYLNFLMNGVEPYYFHNVATAAFQWVIDIPFVFPFLSRKDDLAIDSGRYTMIELEIQYGTLNDFDATPATTPSADSLDITLFRNKSAFQDDGKPVATPYIKHLPIWDTDVRQFADIESARDLELFGFIAVCNHTFTLCAGVPYSNLAAPADNLDAVSFRDNLNTWINNAPFELFQEERAQMSGVVLEQPGLSQAAPPAAQVTDIRMVGVYPWLFAREGTMKQALPTGNRTMLRFETGVPLAVDQQIDLLVIGQRELR